MNRQKLSNISLADFRRYLFEQGCTRVEQGTKGRGGHEKWVKPGLLRPITLQTHVDPVPELIIRNSLSNLGKTKKDFLIGISNNLVIRNTVPDIMLLKLLAKIKLLIAEVKDGGYIEEFHS